MENVIQSKSNLITKMQTEITKLSAELQSFKRRVLELENITNDYNHYKLLAEDLEIELSDVRPKLQDLIDFKVEHDNLYMDNIRQSKYVDTFTASIDTKEDMHNLDVNHLLMSTAEKNMSNHIQSVKVEMNKS